MNVAMTCRHFPTALLPGAAAIFVSAAILISGAIPAPVAAQDIPLIGTFGDWSAFAGKDGGKQVCYAGSIPKKSVGTYKTRGESLVLVTHRPAEKSVNVVSVQAGYTYKKDSPVDIIIDGVTFEMFTDSGHAWAAGATADMVLTLAMKAGKTMVVQGTSSRGTKTSDTYSLAGFTAAYKAIGKACKVK